MDLGVREGLALALGEPGGDVGVVVTPDHQGWPLARAVVVLGADAKRHLASRIAGIRPDAAARAVDALVASEILRGGDPLGFVHPLVRASIHAAILPAELAEGHSHAARLIADEGAAPERIATRSTA
jgi:hypothetical protein